MKTYLYILTRLTVLLAPLPALHTDGLEHLGLDTLRATAASRLDQDNKLIITGGQSATALVSWNRDHPVIQAVVGYGQSAQPASPH